MRGMIDCTRLIHTKEKGSDMAVRIGFIGSGGIADAHVRALGTVPEAQLVAFSDLVEEKANRQASKVGGKVYTDFNAMLDKEQLDAVYLCLPPHAHGAPELACIERRLPFLVEKPLGNSMDVVTGILSRVNRTGLLAAVGYMNRYRRSIQRGRELLKGRKISAVEAHWIGGTPGVAWWRRKDQSGGQLVEQTTHLVDAIVYLVGRASEVYAVGATGTRSAPLEGCTVEDATSVAVKFASGAVASINSCCTAYAGGGGVGLDIYGPDVTLSYRGWEMSLKATKSRLETEEVRGEDNIFELEDRAFVQAVETKDPSLVRCTYAQAYHAHQIAMAANQSLAEGRPVAVAL